MAPERKGISGGCAINIYVELMLLDKKWVNMVSTYDFEEKIQSNVVENVIITIATVALDLWAAEYIPCDITSFDWNLPKFEM